MIEKETCGTYSAKHIYPSVKYFQRKKRKNIIMEIK